MGWMGWMGWNEGEGVSEREEEKRQRVVKE
jgi:hypothetical protein